MTSTKFVELPKTADGIVSNNRTPDSHWGRPGTIEALLRCGRLWKEQHPAVAMSVGQISRKGGGRFPPHKSHQLGVDADMRPMRNDLQNASVTYTDKANYNRELTRRLIQTVRANARVTRVFFNDPVLIAEGLCAALAGHHNHIHFRFNY